MRTAQAPRAPSKSPEAGASGRTDGTIGPNAVLQTLRALREVEGRAAAEACGRRAGVPSPLPGGMIPEAWFTRLIDELRSTLPPPEAAAILRRSGALTGAYVAANRIPSAFRFLLRVLPARWAVPLLLAAFRRHAWTFAGSGRFRVEGPFPGTLVLDGAPTCRAHSGTEHSGSYYEAAFRTLLSLAAAGVEVREEACRALGADACRFRIRLGATDPSGGGPLECASS